MEGKILFIFAQKYVDMEIKIINLPFEVAANAILVTKVSEDNIPRTEEFVTNYAVEYVDCLNDDLYMCYQQIGGIIQVVGTFSFKRNMPPIEHIGDNINCNELSYLIIDLRILNFDCLERVFSIILSLLVNRNDNNDEGIWFNYRGLSYGKKIDNIFKNCREYYFQNESEYFASKIVEIEQQIEENNRRINLLLNR